MILLIIKTNENNQKCETRTQRKQQQPYIISGIDLTLNSDEGELLIVVTAAIKSEWCMQLEGIVMHEKNA